MNSRLGLWILICALLESLAPAQTTASLETSGSRLEFRAGPHAPRLSRLEGGGDVLNNRADEGLIPRVEIAGETLPVTWNFDAAGSRGNPRLVRFVYRSESPRLRLTWEWEV